MRIYITITLIFFAFQLSPAQLSGLFGENAAAISTVALDKGILEVEPTMTLTRVGSEWMGKDLVSLDDATSDFSLSWRVTYGLGNDWEVGFGAPTDFSSIGVSVKRALLTKEVFALGAAVGITESTIALPQGSGDFSAFRTTYGLALLGFWSFEDSSFDLNVQYQDYFTTTEFTQSAVFLNADYGKWAIPGKLRFMLGVGGQFAGMENTRSTLWSIFPAIQYDFLNFSLVLNSQHDFAGYDSPRSNAFSVTFTTIW